MSMRSPDDRQFIQIRGAYHKARAENDYSGVTRIARQNFNWMMDYLERKLSANLSRKARTVAKWKNLHDACIEAAMAYEKGKVPGPARDFRKIAAMVKDIIYTVDPPPSKENL